MLASYSNDPPNGPADAALAPDSSSVIAPASAQPPLPPSTTSTRGRKRKNPPAGPPQQPPAPPPPPPGPPPSGIAPHQLVVMPFPPPGYYPGSPHDFSPGGFPPPPDPNLSPPSQDPSDPTAPDASTSAHLASAGKQPRTLSQSKRAEQNRRAQRAFRERRDQHVKALESRSQLLDAALASADEANRRWEECRALVDQLRIENAALRAALSQAQMMGPSPVEADPTKVDPADGGGEEDKD
ncbi:hypothetical protein K488DRAFT_89427 [Vararia minispora EC-137]|uniref:Uncharacterized protein n=1 Tax=Vararia minispora EC-137 TaxID=1314806 RepID=A0ACB8QA82_9AGAM|nr:hypothetical protein K488DRAFT_89427 [Vararia minispora EC-137]